MGTRRCVNCMEEITEQVCPHCGYREEDAQQAIYGLKRNTILHGKYLIGNVLGQGGFGITYIAFDIALEIKVAIKEYFPMGYVSRDCTRSNQLTWNNTQNGQELWKKGSENFLKEARRMAKIDVLPEIVRVREVFIENQTSYIVMDYVEGETLKAWLSKNGIMKFSECMKMMLPLMNSLNEVHSFGLIHRDISPDNIMVLPNGRIRLLDLGAAKDLGIENNGSSQLVTKKGFSPVEQYLESGKIGPWTDVYALSATIYYCITGKMVPESMERALGGDTLTFDVSLTEKLSEAVSDALRQGLALKTEDRIQTIGELSRRLQETDKDLRNADMVPAEKPVLSEPAEETDAFVTTNHKDIDDEKDVRKALDLEEIHFNWGDDAEESETDAKEPGSGKKVASVLTMVTIVIVTLLIMISMCEMSAVVSTIAVTAVMIGFMNLTRSNRWKKAGVIEIVMAAVTVWLMVATGYRGGYDEDDVFASVCLVVVIVFTNLIRSGRWKKGGMILVESVAATAAVMITEDEEVWLVSSVLVAVLSILLRLESAND